MGAPGIIQHNPQEDCEPPLHAEYPVFKQEGLKISPQQLIGKPTIGGGFIRRVEIRRDQVEDAGSYPFNLPAISELEPLELNPAVTFFVGENGSGKSTLLEAIAVAAGFNPEGGSRNIRFAARPTESPLHDALKVVRNPWREKDGYFMRAEALFNLATQLESYERDQPGLLASSYGGRSLHEQSHGESFFALFTNRFGGAGLYLIDEPEAALSPSRQLAFLIVLDQLVRRRSQIIIATHSPILLAFPTATIYEFSDQGVREIPYRETEAYSVYFEFLRAPDEFIRQLLRADGGRDAGE